MAQALKVRTLDGLGEIKECQVPLQKSEKDKGVDVFFRTKTEKAEFAGNCEELLPQRTEWYIMPH